MTTEPTTQLQTVDRTTLRGLIQSPEYTAAFRRVLGDRTPQFVSSVLSVGNSMPDVEPKSVIAAAMTAATLDLPVDKNLGFAWIVPYREKGVKRAQFQLGSKGYIQLALRTGAYSGLNARAINAEAFVGWSKIGEPEIDWSKIDDSKPVMGYVVGWTMVNGFTKLAMWTKERVIEHAKRYSQSYRGGYDSPWKTHFDPMALKTVVKNELSDWGLMSIETKASVQLQRAIVEDQTVRDDLNSEPRYPDNSLPDEPTPQIGNQATTDEQQQASSGLAPQVPLATDAANNLPRRGRPVGSKNRPKLTTPDPASPAESSPPAEPSGEPPVMPDNEQPVVLEVPEPVAPSAAQPAPASEPHAAVAEFCQEQGITFDDFRDWAGISGRLKEANTYGHFDMLPTQFCVDLLKDATALKRLTIIFAKRG